MEILKKTRTPLRSSFTKTANSLEEITKESESDPDTVAALINQLCGKFQKLENVDTEILELLKNDEIEGKQEAFNIEYEGIEVYNDRYLLLKTKAERLLSRLDSQNEHSSVAGERLSLKKKYKLPKIELKKFNGDVKDWLGFWGQFRKINEDVDIDPGDKYQYLVQATVEGSRARYLVDSFPPTAENYPQVIECLKSRFGRDEVLVEVYVRELLSLVLHNSTSHYKDVSLYKLYDNLETQLRSLDTLGVTKNNYAAMLYPLVESCLPNEVIRVWERSIASVDSTNGNADKNTNKLELLMKFLRNEVEGEERIKMAKSGFGLEQRGNKKITKLPYQFKEVPTAVELFASNQEQKAKLNCNFCEKAHETHSCRFACKLPLDERKRILSKKGCCYVCLKIGHLAKKCKLKLNCFKCQRRHFDIMCPEGIQADTSQLQNKSAIEEENKSQTVNVLTNRTCTERVLLQTMVVILRNDNRSLEVRALLDTGSQKSYITKQAAMKMKYKAIAEEDVLHSLFGGVEMKENHYRYKIFASDLPGNYHCSFEVLDQENICAGIPRLKRGPWVNEVKRRGIVLSDYLDKTNEMSAEIHLLIGADIAGKLLTGKVEKLDCGVVAVETLLGWTLMGKVPGDKGSGNSSLTVLSLHVNNAKITELWALDTLGILDPTETKTRVEIEQATLDHFKKTITIDEEGRYEVCLPWKEGCGVLKENLKIAEQRCLSNAMRLQRERKYNEYDNVFEEWLNENIIEVVPEAEVDNPSHYLPHRGVFKQNSTTKVRPVFDASCRGKDSPSINDCLEKGPNLMEQIPPILMRFRKDKIGVVSDIRKAFLQIAIADKQRDFLRFLWWEDFERRNLKCFRHRRVVFGLTCSPFLLAAVLNHHLDTSPLELKETAEKLKNSFYVDNCVTSVSSEENLLQFIQRSRLLLANACFDLRGWEHTTVRKENEGAGPIPVLGLLWNKDADVLSCDLGSISEFNSSITRRNVLSSVHKIFDPIGFSCPVTLSPKLLIQSSWNLKIGWDEPLPHEMQQKFKTWVTDLPLLAEVKVPRYVEASEDPEGLSIHVFCDASGAAYSAAVFLRIHKRGEVNVHLIQARSRVAPLHKITIPRLELLACCIATRLASTVKLAMDLSNVPTVYWTDSSTALFWIQKEEHWGVFVNNRVKEIRSLSDKEHWRHVPGKLNPADLPSRGCSVKTLLNSRWWEGPFWLKQNEDEWPTSEFKINEDEIAKERRKVIISSLLTTSEENWYTRHFSKYPQIMRMVAWMIRFIRNSRTPDNKLSGELLVTELEAAEKKLLKIIQNESFKEVDSKLKLKTLGTFTDSDGILRLKTKITRREDNDNFLCPIVLPSHHKLVEGIIYERHLQTSHAGVQVVLGNLRQQFWILRGRKTVQRVIAKCVRCRRYAAKRVETVPTPLPEDRVRDALVFEVLGVDLAGPLYLKKGRKAWILLFTCAVYRAVHLELIESLSTNGFVLGLRRFIARRGRPKTVYSDNGTNFTGTNNLMGTLDWDQIVKCTSIWRIQWKFNPPTAAWWGGWWERIVQVVKKLLRRGLGRACLQYEEMLTVLCDAEAVINSRPLTPLSEDPEDLIPLTPSMFIQSNLTVGVPDLDHLDEVNITKRFRYQQRLREDFRRRFREEYLGLLVQQQTSQDPPREIKLNDIVLVGCDNKKRLNWPMGRVVATYPGKDHYTRVVKVKTAAGELIRPVQRVYPLEIRREDYEHIRVNCDEPYSAVADSEETATPTVPVESRVVVKTRSGRTIVRPARYD